MGTESQSQRSSSQNILNPRAGDNIEGDPTQPTKRSPAYVSPIPKIGTFTPMFQDIQIPALGRPRLSSFIGTLLIGKPIDEDGDIVDEKTGQVLARAGGDLPSIVGRVVSNSQGDILGDDGKLLGYVADVELGRTRPPISPEQPRSLFELMGKAASSLMVDHQGNILDASGFIVGKFYCHEDAIHDADNAEGNMPPNDKTERRQQQPSCQSQHLTTPPEQQPEQQKAQPTGDSSNAGQNQGSERTNARAWKKESPEESPSDIFLDVKSTREGVQLTIRIPTVFPAPRLAPPDSS
ncbi:uncharacterized protein CTHT_0031350 [Thermochaetoides thermophila DSM 1495]|uniref:Uncharacterized protein n=1 Tax=Chaetomium thermophilum (strain DSM 1495 / CBS 144.50 / IMI 039719) TaxID=759272 RepID=G0S4K7_CHATD|nr:hypothetical protein CTHT_0031350 [Thermochaetoides thermophila DSM 1495]EGS21282.1 hypothetical protein CTHT_0031350 [Thermochaetoides thermophila DSM 1495]